MYRVYQYGKPIKKLGKHTNYDSARNAARRFIRKLSEWIPFYSDNPRIGRFNVSIVSVK